MLLLAVEDDIDYHVQATDSLSTFPIEVSEVTGPDAAAIQAGLPALNPGWTYRTFRPPGNIDAVDEQFMRVLVTEH
jgi:hypothetical protein